LIGRPCRCDGKEPALLVHCFKAKIHEEVRDGVFARRGAFSDGGAIPKRYDRPRLPEGHGPHHYHFLLAALDVPVLKVDADSKVAELWRAAEPHILAEAEFVGTYETS
jgi:phosphatidylethanolamine-binding protein (PEBP) family uncharacterized protein